MKKYVVVLMVKDVDRRIKEAIIVVEAETKKDAEIVAREKVENIERIASIELEASEKKKPRKGKEF